MCQKAKGFPSHKYRRGNPFCLIMKEGDSNDEKKEKTDY